MIRVNPVVPNDNTWNDWCARAKKATEDLVAGKTAKIDENLYKEQRDWIYNTFHGKCAYCEIKLVGDRYGDLDHYRPKKRVTDKEGKLVFVAGKQHPGYFWLAYHWKNLLPTCPACNRPGTAPDGTKSGKWDKFPVANGFYVTDVNDVLDNEQPTLLNPYVDDPDEHLTFDPKNGVVGAKTPRGQDTIDVLGLNRDDLTEARRKAAKAAMRAFSDYSSALSRADFDSADEYEPEIVELDSGVAEYCAIARAVLSRGRAALSRATSPRQP